MASKENQASRQDNSEYTEINALPKGRVFYVPDNGKNAEYP